MIFYTVPWAPGFERQQLTRLGGDLCYVRLRSTAVVWQLGIRKGFGRETVKARLASDATFRLAVELGMLESECDGLAEEFGQ